MTSFVAAHATADAYWRAINLFGRNSAAYKFALSQSLLQFAERGTTTIPLAELAAPFADALATHLKDAEAGHRRLEQVPGGLTAVQRGRD